MFFPLVLEIPSLIYPKEADLCHRTSYQHALTKYPEMKEVAQQLEARRPDKHPLSLISILPGKMRVKIKMRMKRSIIYIYNAMLTMAMMMTMRMRMRTSMTLILTMLVIEKMKR